MNPETIALEQIIEELDLENWWKEMTVLTNKIITIDTAFANIPKTESYAGKVISRKFKNRLSYAALTDTWYIWDGKVHKPCTGDSIVRKIIVKFHEQLSIAITQVEETANAIYDQSEKGKTAKGIFKSRMKDYRAFRNNVSSSRGQYNMVQIMKINLDLADDHFDDERRWFVIENGVYDVDDVRMNRKFTLLPHDPARNVYRKFNMREEVGATHEWLDKFTSESIADAGQAKEFQKLIASALFGPNIETRSVILLKGAPNSGKSMWTKIMKHFAKDFVAEPTNAAVLSGGQKPDHARYPMRQARYTAFPEITKPLDREFFLKYSGMDECVSEDKWVKSAGWTPQGIMLFASNYGLNIDMTDKATFDRVKPINFPHTFERASVEGHEIDIDLQAKIQSQGSGFLEWLKEGFLLALEEGLYCTDSMDALKRAETDDNPVFQFINSKVEDGTYIIDHQAPKSHFILMNALHAGYVDWCNEHAVPKVEQLSFKNFKEVVQTRFKEANSGGKRVSGIKSKYSLVQNM